MKIIIFSDIHSNLEALLAALNIAERYSEIRLYCLGDIVGYGASPNECLEEVSKKFKLSLKGNHEAALTGLIDTRYFNSMAREAVVWTKRQLDKKSIAYLSKLPFTKLYKNDFFLVHATPFEPEKWHYIFTYEEAEINFKQFNHRICFNGHSHIPIVIESGPFGIQTKNPEGLLQLKNGYRYIINVGSIGQPRDRDWRACFVVYDQGDLTIEFVRVKYDLKTAQKKIIAAGLPDTLAERLGAGK